LSHSSTRDEVRDKMSKKTLLCLATLVTTLAANSQADIPAVTEDGRAVILRDDQTWEFVEQAEVAAEESEATAVEPADLEVLTLAVEKRVEGGRSCTLGLRLTNNSSHKVSSMVPQLSAMTGEDVLFDTVFISFHSIKPTLSQYAEANIRGLSCADIGRIRVHGADRCDFAELDKYNATNGECLARIRVLESELIQIAKD
jgi:hypothetical protein